MQKSDSIKELGAALAQFQADVQNPKNTASNPMFKSKYAPLADVLNTVKPILAKYKLAVIQSTGSEGENIVITTMLIHSSGEWIESEPLILPAYQARSGGQKEFNAQGAGSAITYGRRYQISAMLGISSEDDDDGNHAANNQSKTDKQPQPPQQEQPKQQTGAKVLSAAQLKKINTQISELTKLSGHDREAIKKSLAARSEVGPFEALENITIGQASASITLLQQWIDAQKGGNQ